MCNIRMPRSDVHADAAGKTNSSCHDSSICMCICRARLACFRAGRTRTGPIVLFNEQHPDFHAQPVMSS
jgi:hypothetical protein